MAIPHEPQCEDPGSADGGASIEECGGKKGKGGKGKKGDEVGVKLGVELLRCKSRIQRQILSI